MEAKKREGRGVDGVVPVVPIPFDERENVDEQALRRLVDFAVDCQVGAICLPAYGSEFYKLSDTERLRVVEVALDQAAGRILVAAQCNHGSARVALEMARKNAERGANLISIAIPRQFAISDDDLLRYLSTVLNGVNLPCLVQDFNPGGPTVSVAFVVRLKAECPNFRYIKLEEPNLSGKVLALKNAARDQVGILEGWGGMYMMELVPLGIAGVMPGLAMADILNAAFDLRRGGNGPEAFPLFERVLPQIVFSLQTLELYLYCEKRLLQARGLLDNARCRSAAFTPDGATVRFVDELNDRILQLLSDVPLQSRPASAVK